MARDFDLFRELGITTWRGSFGWDDYEPSPGVYDFAWLHQFAELAASRGIRLRPYVAYTPSWAAAGGSDSEAWNDPPKDLEAWSRFVRALAVAMRRHSNIVSYEIYNEENVRQWWDGSPSAYRELLRRGVEAVKAGNPDAQVLLGGMVYPDREWTEAICGDGGSGRLVDVIPFHAYPETWTPPDVTVETYLGPTFTDFMDDTDSTCGRKPLWINEAGYATTAGRTEAEQARWWVRAVATFVATPRIEHVGVYEIKDLRSDRPAIGDAPNYHLGLTTSDRTKKLAFGTMARLVSMFGEQPVTWERPPLDASTAPSSDVWRYLFTRADGRQFLFMWTRDAEATVTVRLPRDAAEVIAYELDGTPLARQATQRGVLENVVLRPGEPRFFEIVIAKRD